MLKNDSRMELVKRQSMASCHISIHKDEDRITKPASTSRLKMVLNRIRYLTSSYGIVVIAAVSLCSVYIFLDFNVSTPLYNITRSTTTSGCYMTPAHFENHTNCLDAYLKGPAGGAGFGNRIFEFVIYLGISDYSRRRPFLSDKGIVANYEQARKWLPNLEPHFQQMNNSQCKVTKEVQFNGNCCAFDKKNVEEVGNSNASGVKYTESYIQGYKYLSLLPQCYIRHLLKGSPEAERAANNDIFPNVTMRKFRSNLCIQIRRGDFLNHALYHVPDADYIRQAATYIIAQNFFPMDIYVMGNDHTFNEKTFLGWENVYLASDSQTRPINAEWEFSRMYCDAFLITASASTYAWWGAYLSRGQKVYYNAKCCNPAFMNQMNQSEYYPPDWIALNMTQAGIRPVKFS